MISAFGTTSLLLNEREEATLTFPTNTRVISWLAGGEDVPFRLQTFTIYIIKPTSPASDPSIPFSHPFECLPKQAHTAAHFVTCAAIRGIFKRLLVVHPGLLLLGAEEEKAASTS
jgi:hypothetical protein